MDVLREAASLVSLWKWKIQVRRQGIRLPLELSDGPDGHQKTYKLTERDIATYDADVRVTCIR